MDPIPIDTAIKKLQNTDLEKKIIENELNSPFIDILLDLGVESENTKSKGGSTHTSPNNFISILIKLIKLTKVERQSNVKSKNVEWPEDSLNQFENEINEISNLVKSKKAATIIKSIIREDLVIPDIPNRTNNPIIENKILMIKLNLIDIIRDLSISYLQPVGWEIAVLQSLRELTLKELYFAFKYLLNILSVGD